MKLSDGETAKSARPNLACMKEPSVFMLSNDADEKGHRKRYLAYLAENEAAFPKRAFELANSDWYWNWHDQRCPHDAWLESLTIEEADGAVTIRTRLLGAYHDGYIEFTYSNVKSYKIERLNTSMCTGAHGDWKYDEIRLSEGEGILHEIEWAILDGTAHWVIESEDIDYAWHPIKDAPHREGVYQLKESLD